MNRSIGDGDKYMERERIKLWKERSLKEGRKIRSGRAGKQVGKQPRLLTDPKHLSDGFGES